MAAAAWSWVEKMLQEAQRTSAPSAISVSISTAVWMVMWSEPEMRAPFSGLLGAEFLADRHQARHLDLGHVDFLAAPIGKLDVGDVIILGSAMTNPSDAAGGAEGLEPAGYSSRQARPRQ